MSEAEHLPWQRRPPLIVCASDGRWASAWRGKPWPVGPFEPPRLIETRSLVECRNELGGHPAAFVVIELTSANADAVVELLVDQERYWPDAAMAVVADRQLAAWESSAREAGGIGWTTSPRQLRPLVEMACRHVARRARPYETLQAAVEAIMPWRPVNE